MRQIHTQNSVTQKQKFSLQETYNQIFFLLYESSVNILKLGNLNTD